MPAALEAAAILYERLSRGADAAEARRVRTAWRGVEELFRFALPAATARANLGSYAASLGIADAAAALEPVADETVNEYGIALDANLRPLPVMYSDHGFVLAFLDPTEAYFEPVAGPLQRPSPARLMSPAGVMVANPPLAEPTSELENLEVVSAANDEKVLLRDPSRVRSARVGPTRTSPTRFRSGVPSTRPCQSRRRRKTPAAKRSPKA